jgi:outer membrane protein assembly factor BamB
VARRRVVGIVAGVAAVAALIGVAVLIVPGSDAATVDIRVAAAAPQPVPERPLPGAVEQLWSETGTPASTGAVDAFTAMTADSRQLTGRDPATGAERWSYRRGNARLCAWAVQDGVAIAAYRKSTGCTDLIALDVGTGQRRWYRNAELDPAVGMAAAAGVLVVAQPDQLLAIDTATGLNRWTYSKDGCRFGQPVVGDRGTAVLVDCAGGQTRLLLHDSFGEKELWGVPAPADARLISADEAVSVLAGSDRGPMLRRYGDKGRVAHTVVDRRLAVPDGATEGGTAAPSARVTDPALLVWTGTAAVAVDTRVGAVLWSVKALGPPLSATGRALLVEATGFVQRSLSTGKVTGRTAVTGSEPPEGAALGRVGGLVIAGSPAGTTAYG